MSHIHPTAIVDKDAQIDPEAYIGPYCIIGKGVHIGKGTILQSHVVVEEGSVIGQKNLFYPHCVIGAKPQVLKLKNPSALGSVVIGNNNIFREYVTVHRSRYPDKVTQIGNDNLLMVGAHIGHDCVLENLIVLTNYVQVAGHCRIETGVWLAGLVAIHQFVTVGKWAYAAGMTAINRDVPPFLVICGSYPARIRGVNIKGLKRAGLTREKQQKIIDAYKHLYKTSGPLLTKVEALAQQDGLDENVKSILDAIQQSSQHRYGRFLECFRRH